jgi:DNA (cytosine-5)-methyltransferase 1
MSDLGSEPAFTVIDLFAGCGGFTQGFGEFRPVGRATDGPVFTSVVAVEHDTAAAATYSANFGSLREGAHPTEMPPRMWVDDIQKFEPSGKELEADVIFGGPPCQGFSALNRAKKGLDRNSLWREYVRVVSQVKPKVFVIENVDRFVTSAEFNDLLEEVAPGGALEDYELADPWGPASPPETKGRPPSRYLLNAADYGSPQARRRVIVVGVRRDVNARNPYKYPHATHSQHALGRKVTEQQTSLFELTEVGHETLPWRKVADVFSESDTLPLLPAEPRHRTVFFQEGEREIPGVFRTPELHIRRNPVALSLARYAAIPPGGNRKDLRGKWYTVEEDGAIRLFDSPEPPGVSTPVEYLSTDSWDKHDNGTGDVMGRLRPDQPSVTIRTEFFKPEKGRYLHPHANRPITHYEAARIQGFPVDFGWCGSKVEIARQIGNAVPIPLGRAIAESIYSCLHGPTDA